VTPDPGVLATALYLAAVFTAAAALRSWHKRRTGGRPAPGDGHAPVPEAATPPRADAAPGLPAHPVRAAPAPGFTPEETAILDELARDAPPGARNAGRDVADSLRHLTPGVDDATLGRIVFELHGYTLAAAIGIPDPNTAICIITDVFGLAAEDLTHLARMEEVRFDQP